MQAKLSDLIERISKLAEVPYSEAQDHVLRYFEDVKTASLNLDYLEVYFLFGSFKMSKKKIKKVTETNQARVASVLAQNKSIDRLVEETDKLKIRLEELQQIYNVGKVWSRSKVYYLR